MSGTTPEGGTGPDPQQNPYGQPQQPGRSPSGQPPAWEAPPAGQPPTWSEPGGPGYAVAAPEPPQSILNAARLMYVGAALSALGVLLTLLGDDAIRDAIEESNRASGPALTQNQIDAAVSLTIAFTAVIGLGAVGLWLWMASANKKGRSWARTVATVLGGLNILLSLGSLALAGSTTVTTLINLVSLALAVGILWLLYRPESSRYYAAVSGQRR
ncbi:MAG: hypothetical protein ACRDVZ_12370 [Jiangellaceae bacterium]